MIDWAGSISIVALYGVAIAFFVLSHRRETVIDRERLKFYRVAQAWFRRGLDEEVTDDVCR